MARLLAGPASVVKMSSRLTLAEVAQRHRAGLGPAQQRKSVDQRQSGHYECAQWIDVLERIQSHAAQHVSSRIAQPVGGVGVGGFVHTERKDEHDDLEEHEHYFKRHAFSLPKSELLNTDLHRFDRSKAIRSYCLERPATSVS
jgi:hypothetical protein